MAIGEWDIHIHVGINGLGDEAHSEAVTLYNGY